MNVKQTTEAPNDIIAPSQTQSMVDASFNQGQEARKLRLYILGALMEQLIAWLFQDILPNDVMQRHKRAANGQGNRENYVPVIRFSLFLFFRQCVLD